MKILKESGCGLVKLVALIHVGRDKEPKRALAQVVAQMLKKSTQKKSFLSLNQAIEQFGASIEFYPSPLYITSELFCLQRHFEAILPLFFETMYEATFQEDDWAVLKSQNIDQIKQNSLQTDVTADKALSENLFGKNHILGYYSEVADYELIEIDDIRNYYSEWLQKAKPYFFLAGDVLPTFDVLVEKLTQSYSLTYPTRNLISKPETLTSKSLIEVKIPNASQASLRMGSILSHHTIDEYLTLDFLIFCLGGYYSSELMKELRQKKGFTYGVYSYLILFESLACIHISMELDKSNIEASLKEIKKLFLRLNTRGLEKDVVMKQYYSQWLRSSEGALKEISYFVKFHKLGYDYTEFKSRLLSNQINIDLQTMTPFIFDSTQYLKVVSY